MTYLQRLHVELKEAGTNERLRLYILQAIADEERELNAIQDGPSVDMSRVYRSVLPAK